MHIRIFEGSRIYIKIRDKGCGIKDISRAMEPLFTTAPDEERAGLGFAVMESFMDKIKVKSSEGKAVVSCEAKMMEKTVAYSLENAQKKSIPKAGRKNK